MKDFLFMGLIIKEKEYREALKHTDWSVYEGKVVAVTCSVDAIIPHWAWMLAVVNLLPVATGLHLCTKEALYEKMVLDGIDNIDISAFQDKRVVIKGCGKKAMQASAYMAATARLLPVAKSIMYGEPCSTVPIFKRKQ
jgi:hypothetical protein